MARKTKAEKLALLARENHEQRAKDAGLKQATVRVWVKPKDLQATRDAMREAGEPWRQETNQIRESNTA